MCKYHKVRYIVCVFLLPLFFLPDKVVSQVSMTPTILYIHDNSNVSNMYLSNNSNTAKEVVVNIEFQYPSSDEEGNTKMVSTTAEDFNLNLENHVRFFPRRLVLQPNQQQSVRIQVMPNSDMPEGLHWGRLIITSNDITQDADQVAEGAIGARVSVRFQQNVPLFYHRGTTTTGIELTDFRTENSNGQLVLLPKLKRHGNSPYIGSVFSRLMDADGNVVIESRSNALAYFEERRRFTLDVSDIPSGTYTLELEFRTERRDVSRRDLVQADPVVERFTVEL